MFLASHNCMTMLYALAHFEFIPKSPSVWVESEACSQTGEYEYKYKCRVYEYRFFCRRRQCHSNTMKDSEVIISQLFS